MKIETLNNLIGGELLNRPYISEVVSFTDEIDEVRRGSCFFARDEKNIQKAIKNGAYAIITQKPTQILDKEIAWILCKDLDEAIFQIFKYENIKNRIYFTDKITLMLIKKMNLEKKVIVIEKDEDLIKSLSLEERYIVTSIEKFANIFPNTEKIKSKDIMLSQEGLFKSKYNGEVINLPFVYKENFSKAINFFDEFNLKRTLEFELDRFKPIFVNFRFEKVDYGSSDKVLITGIKNDEFFFDELNYIVANTKHAKTIFVNEEKHLTTDFNFAVLVDFEVRLKEKEERKLFG